MISFDYKYAIVLRINSAMTKKLFVLNTAWQMSTKNTSHFFLKKSY